MGHHHPYLRRGVGAARRRDGGGTSVLALAYGQRATRRAARAARRARRAANAADTPVLAVFVLVIVGALVLMHYA